MTRVFIADTKVEERSALRLLLIDLKMEVVGEAADWSTTLAKAPTSRLDMLLVDWDLLPPDLGVKALAKLRVACPKAIVVVLISHLDAREQAALSAGADAFISKGETPERVAERLRSVVAGIPTMLQVHADTAIQVPSDMATQSPADTAIQVPSDTAIQVPTDMATQAPTDMAAQAPADTVIQVPTDTATQAPADPAISTAEGET